MYLKLSILMKKFTLLALCALLFTAVRLVAQPTTAPTAPAQAQADVVSILSNTYTPLASNFTPAVPAAALNFYPDWGQGTTFAEFPVAGNPIKRYGTLDYQGIDFGGSINASSMTTLHWDVFTDVATTLRISLISNTPGIGERYVTRTTAVGWNSIDIPLTEYTSQSAFSVGSIFQFKFEEFPMAYRAGTKSVYLYNLYFWKPANVPTLTGFSVPAKLVGDAAFALTAPTSPSSGAFTYESSNMGVATISGSTVTIVGAGTSTITANQAAAGAYAAGSTTATLVVTSTGPQTAAATPTKLAANVTSLFSNAYTNVGIDTWSAVWDVAAVEDVTIAGNATKKYTNHTYSGIEFTGANLINATSRTHIHMDVWTADAAGADGFKVKLVDFGPNGIYQGMPDDDANSIELPFTPTASGWFAVDVPLTSFTGLATKANLAQMVLVTPGGGKTFWLDNVYLYNEPVAGPTEPTTAAATPTRPAANVISLYSNAYTDLAGTGWNRYNGGTAYAEVMVATNATQKYTNLSYSVSEPAATINATTRTHLHLDVWTATAGTDFKVKLVDFGPNGVYQGSPNDDTEHEVTVSPNPGGGAWVSYDIPLADFTGLAARANLAQFIISSVNAGRTFWLDNIYFYANTAIPVELVNFKAKTNNTTTVLSWNTASERNNQGFTIERSTNATDFTAIGSVKGNGTTSTPQQYTFTDNTPSVGVNYYRLRQTDFNGKEDMSKVVAVVFGKTSLVLSNTLVHNTLDVIVSEAETTPLSIFNVSGQLVYSVKVQGTQRIDLSHLTAGVYIVRTATGEAKRFVKD
jgi:Secretion system C-terminal sorting domain